ncbi:MAG TPA: hypothetical protein VGB85_00110 [Nannocystis sp.]|jgi:hypothetical protein
MGIKRVNISNTSSGTAPLGPLRAGQYAKRSGVMSAMADADRALGNGRRVLARVGLHGEAAHQVVSTNTTSATQTYPTKTASRVALRWKGPLTPGHFPTVSAIVVPAGATQKAAAGGFVLDAVVGWIDIIAEFSGPASETVTHTFALPASGNQYGGEGADAGWAWAALRKVGPAALAPAGALQNAGTMRTWSEGVTVELTVIYRGGVRCVDLVLQEQPFAYARSVGIDAASTFSSPLAVSGDGKPAATYPSSFPLEELSPTDPTFGTALLADVVHRQHSGWGPVLAQWSGWRESQAVTATAAVGVSTTSLTYLNMLDTSLTTWSSASPGWSLASGGQAQQWLSSNSHRTTRDVDACVPVRCWVYGSRTGSGASTIRFQSENFSIVEVSITSSTDGWWSATGHLRCGLGPEDTSTLQVLGKLAAAGTLTIRHIVVEYVNA